MGVLQLMLTDEKLSMFDKMKRADFRAAFMEYKNILYGMKQLRNSIHSYRVRYKVDGTNRYKCGYVLWKGGCK